MCIQVYIKELARLNSAGQAGRLETGGKVDLTA